MSSDRLALSALERKTKAQLRYFELVELVVGQDSLHRCYICVGNHALFLVSHNLSGILKPCGEIKYEHIDGAIEDAKSTNTLLLILNGKRHEFFSTPQVVINAEHRCRLLVQFRCGWQTSYLWRNRTVGELPFTTRDLGLPEATGLGQALGVQPYHGYQVATHEGYSFFLQKDYHDVASNLHSASSGTFVGKKSGLTFTIQIQEPRPLSELETSGTDQHIRWVASRQRQSISAELSSTMVIRSAFYSKKMNLVNDVAAWTGWEILLKSDTQVRVMISLRRQFLPPLADSAQDIFVTLQCPKHVIDHNQGITDELLLGEARLAADSLSPLVQRCTVPQSLYRDMIQAKIDSLLFSEESMLWLKGSLGLQPNRSLEWEARIFVKSILKILQEENVLRTPDLLKDVGDDVPTEKEPINVPKRMLPVGGPRHFTDGVADVNDPSMNAWHFRVAKYLAFCFDGGLCGPRLALMDLVCEFISTPQSQQKIDEVVMFLLHIRPKDFTQPFRGVQLRFLVHDPNLFENNIFNDRVMHGLVELGWFEQALLRGDGKRNGSAESSAIENYAQFLARLLECKTASINLKAAVCRQIMKCYNRVPDGGSDDSMRAHFGVLCQALMEMVRQSTIYLRAYATLTLVNMASAEEVQNEIMKMSIIDTCIKNLKSSDDDLIRYTLALLTHLTKSLARVKEMDRAGVTDVVLMLLEKTPSMASKQPLLAELAGVVGQLCNDDDVWKKMCHHPCHPVEKLMTLYYSGPQGGRLRSKAVFALKMFVDRPKQHGAVKREAVATLAKTILEDLAAGCKEELLEKKNAKNEGLPKPEANPQNLDFAANSILLLGSLSKSAAICSMIAKNKDAEAVLTNLTFAEIGQVDSTRDKLHKLLRRVSEAVKHDRHVTGKPS